MTVRPDVRHYCPGGREAGGGIGRLVGYIADEAALSGADHAVCDTRGPRWSHFVSPGRLFAAAATMMRDRATAPDRLHHIHLAGRGSTARKLLLTGLARALRCRHVLHLHDYDYRADYVRRPDWIQREVRRMFRGADQVIVLGERDRAFVEAVLGANPARVSILPNCVPDPGARGAATDPPLILFLGRLGVRKGVPDLLAALAHPSLADLPWRAVLAGDGPVDEYRATVRALGLAERVAIPGWLETPAVRELCRDAALLVLPSQAEGLAMAVVEGLAHGITVVTTRVGAHEEVITDGVNGRFVPVGDPAALTAAMAALLRDPCERERLGAAGRACFLDQYGMGAYLPRLHQIYRAVATHERRRRDLPSRRGA